MSSSAPTKRDRETNTLPSGKGLFDWFAGIISSTVGSKIIVALTGLGLTVFVIVHLIGNLQIFAGQEPINAYAKFLKDLGPALWIARIGLLTIFLFHITLTILLKRKSAKARPVAYRHVATIQASAASRTMLSTGIVIGLFVLFHLAHFTFAWVETVDATQVVSHQKIRVNYHQLIDAQGRHDVYSMVVAGFKNPFVSMFYILAQMVLFVHLSHGISSVFQTLGFNSPRSQRFLKWFGWIVAALIAIGNIAIVVSVWTGVVPQVLPMTDATTGY